MRSTCIRPPTIFLVAAALLPSLAAGASPAKDPFTAQQRQYWAFQRVERPSPPSVANSDWVRNPIDAFVLRRLEDKGLTPSSVADKITLLRRASFNLIGLPPTPQEVDAFLADESPEAFEKVVNRLLDSPHYGERWARHWLDLARYAESNGFRADENRPHAWRYRDYVINAFNEDKPYDRFVREQIAGDELWPHSPQARVATAFNRHYPDETNAGDLMLRRQEILQDITDVVGLVFMGLTVGCAKCHDHKFDPILQKDYYRLQAFFAAAGEDNDVAMWPQDRIRDYKRKLAVWEQQTKHIRDQMAELVEPERKATLEFAVLRFSDYVNNAVRKAPEDRTAYEVLMVQLAWPEVGKDTYTLAAALEGEAKQCFEELKEQLKQYEHLHPGEYAVGYGLADAGREAPPSHVLTLANYDAKQEEVEPGFLTILNPEPARITPPEEINSTGRRAALADWIADPKNPLTARVMVNRIWHYHFGQGIVRTPSDFGMMGERPTHPELLDWLADEFIRSGWSMKHMHRLIMTSSTCRQDWANRESAGKVDPFNRLLWRFPTQRLEAEVIRDSALYVAGLLDTRMSGKSVVPPLPAGMTPPKGWEVTENPADRFRRSTYFFVKRNTRYPLFQLFDMPDTHESCASRSRTTTAPQALALLNNEDAIEWAQAFAGRVIETAGLDRAAQVEHAYRLAYGRQPTAWDKDTVVTFFAKQRDIIAERAAAGEELALPTPMPEGVGKAEGAALVDFCHTLLNSNEFVYRR